MYLFRKRRHVEEGRRFLFMYGNDAAVYTYFPRIKSYCGNNAASVGRRAFSTEKKQTAAAAFSRSFMGFVWSRCQFT